MVETIDNDGTTYIYRGNITNNYINFAGMCWRIVRINGDNSIKIILEDQDQTCSSSMDSNWSFGTGYFGYYLDGNDRKMDFVEAKTNTTSSMNYAFQEFQQNLSNKLGETQTLVNTLKSGGWCLEESVYKNSNDDLNDKVDEERDQLYTDKVSFYYGAYVRLNTNIKPNLECDDKYVINNYKDGSPMYVGTLTVDEVRYTGSAINKDNTTSFLYTTDNSSEWWTLSPSYVGVYFSNSQSWDLAYYMSANNQIEATWVSYTRSFRPAVNLLPEVKITGTGTITDPFVVE